MPLLEQGACQMRHKIDVRCRTLFLICNRNSEIESNFAGAIHTLQGGDAAAGVEREHAKRRIRQQLRRIRCKSGGSPPNMVSGRGGYGPCQQGVFGVPGCVMRIITHGEGRDPTALSPRGGGCDAGDRSAGSGCQEQCGVEVEQAGWDPGGIPLALLASGRFPGATLLHA
jgi:hypothetical protein